MSNLDPRTSPLIHQLKTITDPITVEHAIRAAVLHRAQKEIGTTDPTPYFEDAAPCYSRTDWLWGSKSWCQIFVLYCYRQIQLTRRLWQAQTGFASALPTIRRDAAQPADMTILENTRQGCPVWHGNLLLCKDGDCDTTVDGNTSDGVARRTRSIRDYSPPPIYKSIQPWIDQLAAGLDELRGIRKR